MEEIACARFGCFFLWLLPDGCLLELRKKRVLRAVPVVVVKPQSNASTWLWMPSDTASGASLGSKVFAWDRLSQHPTTPPGARSQYRGAHNANWFRHVLGPYGRRLARHQTPTPECLIGLKAPNSLAGSPQHEASRNRRASVWVGARS